MNIETLFDKECPRIVITKFYGGIGLTLKTDEGKELNICLRDSGFECNIDGGQWHTIEDDSSFAEIKSSPAVEQLNDIFIGQKEIFSPNASNKLIQPYCNRCGKPQS